MTKRKRRQRRSSAATRRRGAPTKYRAAYCAQLTEHMAAGYSFESFAALLDVAKQTLYNWTKDYEDFLDAKERGTEKSRLWWERLGIQGVQGLGPECVYQRKAIMVTAIEEGQEIEVPAEEVIYRAATFVPGTWFRNMVNRFPDEWRDRQEVTGKDGEPLLPPIVPWETLKSDSFVKAWLAKREGTQPGAGGTAKSASRRAVPRL